MNLFSQLPFRPATAGYHFSHTICYYCYLSSSSTTLTYLSYPAAHTEKFEHSSAVTTTKPLVALANYLVKFEFFVAIVFEFAT